MIIGNQIAYIGCGLLSFTFLSPLNHFLKAAGCEPKFVLLLSGKTGSRKSTLAALMLSFFGKFTASELPLSFRDTANSILHNAFALKDVLTCIDDLHPSSRMEEPKMNGTAQAIMRAYGDRTGKGRLRADSTPMESRPPQGNAIITAEFAPDIGESGTARYFALELKEKDVDLKNLTSYQNEAAKGTFQRCMYAYTQWISESFFSPKKLCGIFRNISMPGWLDEYIIQLNSESKPKVDPIATALEAVQAQLAGLQQQQDTLCDYLEKGVYTIGMFTKRNATLAKEIKHLQSAESDLLRQQGEGKQKKQSTSQIIPTTQHILDNYDTLTIAEKNRLWKLVMPRATVYRSPDNELTVNIYPNLPK